MTNPYAFLERYPQWTPTAVTPDPEHPGKLKKVTVNRAGHHVSAVDPANWMTRAEAIACGQAHHSFVLHTIPGSQTAVICFDFDNCFEADRKPNQTLQDIMAQLGDNVLWEVSVSGNGVHGWCWGIVPPHSMKNTPLHIEAYSDKRHIVTGTYWFGSMEQPCLGIAAVLARYFPVAAGSGDVSWDEDYRHPDWVGPALSDEEVVRLCSNIKSTGRIFGSKATFQELMEGDPDTMARYYPSTTDVFDRSSADLALFSDLAWATGHNAAQMVRVAHTSGLAREKWDRDDYIKGTVARGTAGSGCYKAKPSAAVDRAAALGLHGAAAPAESAAAPGGPVPGSYKPEAKANAGRTFVSREDQIRLFQGCVYVTDLHKVLIANGQMLRPDQFRTLFGGYAFLLGGAKAKTTNSAWEAFTENQDVEFPRADTTTFRPEFPFGHIVMEGRRRAVNVYMPPNVRMVDGDATPFLDHLKRVLPNGDDATILLSYLAACVQYPGRKFPWCPVLQGVEGNGKTFFSTVTAYAVGDEYTHWPRASKLGKQFNAWMVNKVLYCVEDIYTPGQSGEAVLEEMKPMVTGGRGLEIEGKGVDQYSANICGNFIINTNHKDGIRKTLNDRRYGMLFCAQQDEASLNLAFGPDVSAYMRRLYEWLDREDGKAICAYYLAHYEIPERFDPTRGAQRAPRSSSYQDAVDNGRGIVEQLVLEAVEEGKMGFRGDWVSSTYLKGLLEDSGHGRFMSPIRRKQMMKTIGWVPHPALEHGRTHNAVAVPDGGRPILYVKPGSANALMTTPAEIAKAYAGCQV